MKLYIEPTFSEADKGDGGIRRVVEAQRRWLPQLGIQIVDNLDEADIVNCHAVMGDMVRRWLDKHPLVPLVASNHGLYWAEYEWAKWALTTNRDCMELIRRANLVTAPSEWVAQVLRRHTMRDIAVVGHGINLEDWESSLENEGYVLWNKTRQDPVCDPAPVNELAKLMPETQFVSTFGTSTDNVRVIGTLFYADAREMLKHAAIYLCTTRETLGIGTLEAMAAGVPVVGWAWGGQRELLEHKKTGWLVNPGDIKGLIEGVHWALDNRADIAAKTRAIVEKHYQWQSVIERYASLYKQVLESVPESKVSVIVTAYNLEQYLPDCLESVQNQSLKEWECVIVDDASPDGCGRIADEWAAQDPRFRVIHNQENQYLAGARNTGIASAKGKYIIPLDADDMLAPAALELLSNALDYDRSIHIAYGNVRFVEPDGRAWHSGWPMVYRHDWQLMQRNLLPYCSMYRREVWEATRGYRTRCRTAEDADFWARASSYGFRPSMVVEADTLIYRNREDSMSRQIPAAGWAEWFPWAARPELTPAGAVTEEQVPIPSLEPVRISVIIPVGPGHEHLVLDAIDSVDAQTFRQWECIVVNDTGHSLPPLPSWVRTINIRGAPVGVAGARNAGIYESKASLFVSLDADDYLEPEALEVLLQAWEQVGGVVYSDWWEQWEDGRVALYRAPDYDASLLVSKGCLHAVTALYPREAWERVGGFDRDLVAWEDWDFQLALADIGVCGSRIPAPLFVYRKELGRRRDQNYTDFEASKEGIKTKWGALWDPKGGKELMGCHSCSGGGGKVMKPQSQAIMRSTVSQLPPPSNDVVVVEYTGQQSGSVTYAGPSGAIYRFNNSDGGRIKYVLKEDAQFFAERTEFVVLWGTNGQRPEVKTEEELQPALIALGPPNRNVP